MTIRQAIDRFNNLRPNMFDYSTKISWISEIEQRAVNEVMKTHEGVPEDFETPRYTVETPEDTELLIGEPHTNVYIEYMRAMADYTEGEFNQYNNSSMMFNGAYNDWENWYHANHMPIQKMVRVNFDTGRNFRRWEII